MNYAPMDFENEERRLELAEWLRENLGEPKRRLVCESMPQKNSNRNKPCHCGSGRKFKKCCWRGL